MARSRRSRTSQDVTTAAATTTQALLPSVDDNFDDEEQTSENTAQAPPEDMDEDSNDSTTTALVPNDDNGPVDDSKITRLKSNVWNYARKLRGAKAKCGKCPSIIQTPHGSTSTLRKHLVTQHDLINIKLPSKRRIKKNISISREKKDRLDHLIKMAIIEDGRSFGDFRKSGMAKVLDEAVPGN